MKAILDKVRREPALLVGLVTAILIALTEFGWELTQGQQAAIVGVTIAIGAIIVRQAVTPNVSVGALEDPVQTNGGGDLMAGQASTVPTGDPVDVVPSDGYSGLDRLDGLDSRQRDELGAYDTGSLLFALACIVVIACGIVWLVNAL